MGSTKKFLRGNAAIEFILVTPLVLTILAGIVDGGSFLVTRHAVCRAARDGARVGAITIEPPPASGDDIIANAIETARASLTASGYTEDQADVSASWSKDSNGRSWLKIDIALDHAGFFGNYSPFASRVTHNFTIYTQEQIN